MSTNNVIKIKTSDILSVESKPQMGVLIMEAVMLLCLAIILQVWASTQIDQFPIHPFLAIVILLTAQYGTVGGIITTLVATAIELVGFTPERLVGQDYFSYNLAIWSDPLSWLVIALFLGLIVDRYRLSIATFASELEDKASELELVCKHHDVLADRVRRLERRIAGFTDADDFQSLEMKSDSLDHKRPAVNMPQDFTDQIAKGAL